MSRKEETLIEAGNVRWFPDLREAWSRRGLLLAFVRRGLAVRYRQAAIGILWSVLQPALTVGIFTFVFNYVANLDSDGLPYSVFAATGMTCWLWFARSLQEGANSLVMNQAMVTKVWFPRLLLPAATIVEAAVEYGVMLLLVAGLAAWHHVEIGWSLALWPVFAVIAGATAMGLSFWFSALNVSFRDVRVVVPFILQAGMFATPVIWSPESLSPAIRPFVAINPLAFAIDGMRWGLGGTGSLMTPLSAALAIAMAGLLLLSGAAFFARIERRFADII